MELLKQLYLVEVQQVSVKHKPTVAKKEDYDFSASAGLWENTKIDTKELRDKAWKRNTYCFAIQIF